MKKLYVPLLFLLIFFAYSDGDSNDDNFTGHGYHLLAGNIGNLVIADGSFQLFISRLDASAAEANDAVVTLNDQNVPLIIGSSEDATYLLNHIGYDQDDAYILSVTIDGMISTCNFTIPGFDGITINSPDNGSYYTSGDAIDVQWSFDGGHPPRIEFYADDDYEGEEPDSNSYDYEQSLEGSVTSHTIPVSVTDGLSGGLWIEVNPTFDAWAFCGDVHSSGSGIVQVYAAEWITLLEAGSGTGNVPDHIVVDAHSFTLPADGSSSTNYLCICL